jgi:hypothetical protein
VVIMKSSGLWVVTPCSSERVQHFGGTYRFHHQGYRICLKSRYELSLLTASAGGLPFDPETSRSLKATLYFDPKDHTLPISLVSPREF